MASPQDSNIAIRPLAPHESIDQSFLAKIHALEKDSYPQDEGASLVSIENRARHARELFVVAVDEATDGLVGFVNGTRGGEELLESSMTSHDPLGPTYLIHSVVVHAEHRRRGLGSKLLRFAVDRARDAAPPIRQIKLVCKPKLARFYYENGFAYVGDSTKLRHGEETWLNFELLLTGPRLGVADAFTQPGVFPSGNSAAVVLLQPELKELKGTKRVREQDKDESYLALAKELNLSETAFVRLEEPAPRVGHSMDVVSRLVASLEADSVSNLLFSDILSVVNSCLVLAPQSHFEIGPVKSPVGSNVGSLTVLAFAKLLNLSRQETSFLWGEHTRDVLRHAEGTSHPNIREHLKGADPRFFIDGKAVESCVLSVDVRLLACLARRRHTLVNMGASSFTRPVSEVAREVVDQAISLEPLSKARERVVGDVVAFKLALFSKLAGLTKPAALWLFKEGRTNAAAEKAFKPLAQPLKIACLSLSALELWLKHPAREVAAEWGSPGAHGAAKLEELSWSAIKASLLSSTSALWPASPLASTFDEALRRLELFAFSLGASAADAARLLLVWGGQEDLVDVVQRGDAAARLSRSARLAPHDVKRELLSLDTPKASIRWFTPTTEVALCGHATLAAAHLLLNTSTLAGTGLCDAQGLTFATRSSGELRARAEREGRIELDFPVDAKSQVIPDDEEHKDFKSRVAAAIGVEPTSILAMIQATTDLVVRVSEASFWSLAPDMEKLRAVGQGYRCTCVTALGGKESPRAGDAAFVSRVFGPQSGIQEDPVTGSAHCYLAPYYAKELGGLQSLLGFQASERGGFVACDLSRDGRVRLSGTASTSWAGVCLY